MGPLRPHAPAGRNIIRVRRAGPRQRTRAQIPAPQVMRFDKPFAAEWRRYVSARSRKLLLIALNRSSNLHKRQSDSKDVE